MNVAYAQMTGDNVTYQHAAKGPGKQEPLGPQGTLG
jgi:hypothetical protein